MAFWQGWDLQRSRLSRKNQAQSSFLDESSKHKQSAHRFDATSKASGMYKGQRSRGGVSVRAKREKGGKGATRRPTLEQIRATLLVGKLSRHQPPEHGPASAIQRGPKAHKITSPCLIFNWLGLGLYTLVGCAVRRCRRDLASTGTASTGVSQPTCFLLSSCWRRCFCSRDALLCVWRTALAD